MTCLTVPFEDLFHWAQPSRLPADVCTYGCGFCAFSKGKLSEDLRGSPYLIDLGEVSRRTAEAWDRGASEVCMQGGIHPDFTGGLFELDRSTAETVKLHICCPYTSETLTP